MKNIFYIIILISLSRQAFGQTNLVPNPSFEIYTICPPSVNTGSPDYVTYCTGWHSSLNTPDYFNSCSSSTLVGVPSNNFGNQSAYNGNAYCGFWTYFKSSLYREVITAQLISPLSIGQKYFVSLKVSLADKLSYSYCGVDKIGALFSTKLYNSTNPAPTNNLANVFTNTIITDSTSWTTINGSFVSDSTYNYINIGNFFNNANTNISVLHSVASISYYYLDDVRVSTDSTFVLSVVKENTNNKKFKIYPNPSSDILSVEFTDQTDLSEIRISNVFGQIIVTKLISKNDIVDLSGFADGVYNIQILSDKNVFCEKLIVRH